jgi:hypothetical protein
MAVLTGECAVMRPRNPREETAMLINRRQALIGSVGAAPSLAIYPAFGQTGPVGPLAGLGAPLVFCSTQ